MVKKESKLEMNYKNLPQKSEEEMKWEKIANLVIFVLWTFIMALS